MSLYKCHFTNVTLQLTLTFKNRLLNHNRLSNIRRDKYDDWAEDFQKQQKMAAADVQQSVNNPSKTLLNKLDGIVSLKEPTTFVEKKDTFSSASAASPVSLL